MGDSFYEVLYEDNGDQLLKRYDVKYKAGSVSRLNGSVGKPTVSLEFRYLINSEEEIKMIELTKKSTAFSYSLRFCCLFCGNLVSYSCLLWPLP